MADVPALRSLMAAAIDQLQRGHLSEAQIVASRAIMGLDTQLIEDGTYFLAETETEVVGSGGWSRRATLYGGDHSTALRAPRLLDPLFEEARIRAMYTAPGHARTGVGRLILATCEAAARKAGFGSAELMATLSGEQLYRRCGYEPVAREPALVEGVEVPLLRMRKSLDGA